MSLKIALPLAAALLLLACCVDARHVASYQQDYELSPAAGRRPHPVAAVRSVPHKQARVFPGALAIKKLVLLKFKKIVPISLILLKSGDDNEAELVPVYPTSEIPANVQFIPTPNGLSGHKDVQAIAIPSEFHQQLELNGLANLEHIEALLSQAETDEQSGDSTVTIVEPMPMAGDEDEELNVKEDDEDQLLEGVSIAEQPLKPAPMPSPLPSSSSPSSSSSAAAVATTLRRLAGEDFARPGLKASHHTTVEEIPLFLYSTKDTPQMVYGSSSVGSKRPGGRFVAIRRQQH